MHYSGYCSLFVINFFIIVIIERDTLIVINFFIIFFIITLIAEYFSKIRGHVNRHYFLLFLYHYVLLSFFESEAVTFFGTIIGIIDIIAIIENLFSFDSCSGR